MNAPQRVVWLALLLITASCFEPPEMFDASAPFDAGQGGGGTAGGGSASRRADAGMSGGGAGVGGAGVGGAGVGGAGVGGAGVGGAGVGGTGGGGAGGDAFSCVGRSEPAVLGGCLPERPWCGFPARWTLERGQTSASCQIRWRDPLEVEVAIAPNCPSGTGPQSSVRWLSDGGCDFSVYDVHSQRFLVNGQCWGVFHTITIVRGDGGAGFWASTSGYGEGGSCPAEFELTPR